MAMDSRLTSTVEPEQYPGRPLRPEPRPIFFDMATDNEKNEILGLIADLARATAEMHGPNADGGFTSLNDWRRKLANIEERAKALRAG